MTVPNLARPGSPCYNGSPPRAEMTPPKFPLRDIRLSVPVRARPERVWRCLTSARELCAWWTDRAETDARNGGRLRLVWPATAEDSAREARGTFVDLDPARKVAWVWAGAPRGVPPLVSFFVEARRGGSTLTLHHGSFSTAPSASRRFQDWERLWQDGVAKLALYAETGRTVKSEQVTLEDLPRLKRVRSPRPGVLLAR